MTLRHSMYRSTLFFQLHSRNYVNFSLEIPHYVQNNVHTYEEVSSASPSRLRESRSSFRIMDAWREREPLCEMRTWIFDIFFMNETILNIVDRISVA